MKKILYIITAICITGWQQQAAAQKKNAKLITQLMAIHKSDQAYRGKLVEDTAKKYGWYSRQVSLLTRRQELIDRENLKAVEQLFQRYGYPGKTLVGDKYKSVAFLVVQHNDQEAQEKYLPLFQDAAKRGELNSSSLALMIDRVQTGRGKLQTYGTQMHQAKYAVQVQDIEDEPNVDKRRAAVGLPPLSTYLKGFGINYQLPAAGANPNPDSIYYHQTVRREEAPSPVELIGSSAALHAKLVYPQQAKEHHITGRVTLEMVIDKNGVPRDISVVRGLGYGCDEEAVRVMKTARFTNAKGEDHEMRMSLPFPYVK